MPGIVLAWLAGESLIFYRSFKNDKRPPLPGQLLASSGVFAVLGLLGSAQSMTFIAGALAWGFDIAAFMNVAPEMLTGGSSTKAATTKKKAQVQAV
jgi:hypothetical protein